MLSHGYGGAAQICGDGESVTKRNWDMRENDTALAFLYVVGSTANSLYRGYNPRAKGIGMYISK